MKLRKQAWFLLVASVVVASMTNVPIVTAQQPISAPAGMGHYCSQTWSSSGEWAFIYNANGKDPCGRIKKKFGSGGTTRRAGLYSKSGTNTVVARCEPDHVGVYIGNGNDPLRWAYKAAKGHEGCIFTVAPKDMPIFDSPFRTNEVTNLVHGSGFDFSRPPYAPLNVQEFGQSGSTAATIVNHLGQDRSPGTGVGYIDNHDAHDWGLAKGGILRAVADGVVVAAREFDTTPCLGVETPMQKEVYIKHTVCGNPSSYCEEFVSYYTHLDSYVVSAGQSVAKGQMIGKSGATGCASGPHLHFSLFRLTNTAKARFETFALNPSGSGQNSSQNNSTLIDPYGWNAPEGVDPWGWRAYPDGALSINLWSNAPPLKPGNWTVP